MIAVIRAMHKRVVETAIAAMVLVGQLFIYNLVGEYRLHM